MRSLIGKEEIAAVLRAGEDLGDCVPENIDEMASAIAHQMAGAHVLELARELRDSVCRDPAGARAELLAWIHEEQARSRADRLASLGAGGLPVRMWHGGGDHHVVVQMDGVVLDPSCERGGER